MKKRSTRLHSAFRARLPGIQNLDDISGFPMTANEYQDFDRENVKPDDGKTYVINGLKGRNFWRSRHVA